VLFRFRAPASAVRVHLAGSFNAFAQNRNGAVSGGRFAMTQARNGLWFKRVEVDAGVHKYKFVAVDKDGKSTWLPDPHVAEADADGNSVLDFSKIGSVQSNGHRVAAPDVPKPFRPLVGPLSNAAQTLDVRAQNVWVRPDQTNAVLVALGGEAAGARLSLEILTPFGDRVFQSSSAASGGENRLPVPALKQEGGFLARVSLARAGQVQASGEVVLSSVQNVADDLRYGFYATYRDATGDFDGKAAMLAAMHVNAVEFYDYFPAHGYYAPREENYKFEPFGIALNARNVARKIEAGHKRNILALAYVASYAASQSVYRQHPHPMTDAGGTPKIFNGSIMSEAEADRQKKDKWFWLMDISGGSAWHTHILSEFARTLDDSPNDLVSFDGFELDTYGDTADARFYAPGSRRNGDLLSDVLRDFVGDVRATTRRVKPHGLVSFNSVNEFGAEKMYDVTDFAFLEIWSGHTEYLEDLVDICFRHRAALRQRVILKLYPADMKPGRPSWPVAALRRVLGATMTGAGSLMAVGEPDEKAGRMHALNTLFYPDHQPLAPENEALLRDYYRFDVLMLGTTHGAGVHNTPLDSAIPGCVTRTYAAPAAKTLAVQILNVQDDTKWTLDTPAAAPRRDVPVALELPGGVAPRAVLFASPDIPALQKPVALSFELSGGTLRASLPELHSHGVLILRY
jgi:hypothetical protein